MVLKDKNKLSSLKKKKTKQMLSICKVNSQFKKIRIHKGIPNDTLKIRSKMQKCATTNI